MLTDDSLQLFSRNLGTLNAGEQQRLGQATVTVIGCGGLGGLVIEELLRLGVGRLLLCDPDRFEPSNCNRQLYATRHTLGYPKAEVAARRVREVHGLTEAIPVVAPFQEAVNELFSATDVVVDCLDNGPARRALSLLCQGKHIPLVHGAVERWYGQVGVQMPGSTLVADLYRNTTADPEARPPSVLSCTVGVIASLQAMETCKLILDQDSPLHDTWMSVDLRSLSFELIG
ncbi:thiamine biosynthesis protein ThiF [Desulfolithobacter dissulfuricans]|uniref:Thiamine biosynthesis protein ThiF n=1 Tax=Desulfolithobacter dissulfuricans TaxID=2795293 RepID=A0A915TZ19_9BACT|nr:ThiF family adenylyltransferase [Desulfolithobacter dissulfuricans]BCO08418.1 thiamine biosynthesis protein ThiF [Desulfolithobacter dissulfuricans]